MILSYAVCNSSLMPVRATPAHSSEMVNQLLFGERVEILEIDDKEWAHIYCGWDGYEGWCKMSQLSIITRQEYRKPTKNFAYTDNNVLLFDDSSQWIPMGSELYGMKAGRIAIAGQEAKYKGKRLNTKKIELNPDAFVLSARHYLNSPYLWGGRSVAGIDCSGLVQIAFKLCNKEMPRDASQQAEQGELIDFLQHAEKGDLAFFDNEEGKINHVGILLDKTHILHATDTSGKVVIDKIDQGGIISRLLRRRTHNLRMVRRYF